MTINLNDTIKFKLTDYGKEIWYHRYDDLNKAIGREVTKPSPPKMDYEGYTKMQLWEFINLYGQYIHMGAKNVIEPLDLILERGDSEDD